MTADQDIESFLPNYQPLLNDWLQMSQMSKAFVAENPLRRLKIRTRLITMVTSNEDQSNVLLSSPMMYSRVS